MAKRTPARNKTRPPLAAVAPATTPAQATKRARNESLATRDINRVGVTRLKLTGVIRLWFGQGRVAVILETIVAGPKGPHRDYWVTVGRPDWIGLKKQIGDDLGQWAGQVLEVCQDPTGQYVNVVDAEGPASQRASAEPVAPASDDDIPF